MLKLTTPITIHPDTFDGLMVVRLEIDFRHEFLTAHLAPVTSSADKISLGREENGELLAPEILRTVQISQNQQDPDPLIAQFFDAFYRAMEKIEQVLVAHKEEEQGLAKQTHQIGMTKWSLDVAYEPIGNRTVGREKRAKPAASG